MIGKMYKLVKARMGVTMGVAVICDKSFKVVDYMKRGDTFVVLECISEMKRYGKIHKLKLLTEGGHVGYTTFWDDEIKIVKCP